MTTLAGADHSKGHQGAERMATVYLARDLKHDRDAARLTHPRAAGRRTAAAAAGPPHLLDERLQQHLTSAERDIHRASPMRPFAFLIAALFVSVPLQGQTSADSTPCVAQLADSGRFGTVPVFNACGVDRPAKLRRTPRLRLNFRTDLSCLVAEMEFAIDEQGVPIAATAVVLTASTTDYGALALASLPNWQYTPAMQGGHPVRQVVVGRIATENALPGSGFRVGERAGPRGPQPVCR